MIDYHLISKCIKKYEDLGYKYIDVPWFTTEKIVNITLPPGKKAFHINGDYLVGSAEQSFLHLIINHDLKNGKYVAATPCFRDDEIDEYHQKCFFKIELINYSNSYRFDNFDLMNIISDAQTTLSSLTSKTIESLKTNSGVDLTINNVEIGSYGIRRFSNFNWIYGTGLAEPRFSSLNNE